MTRWSPVCAVATVVVAALAAATPASTQSEAAGPVLVMPFENPGGEGRLYWLREASSVLLTDDLRAAGLEAIDRDERMRAFEQLGVPAGASLSDATIIRIGNLLGASTVVVGSISLDQDQLTVRARSIRIDVGLMEPECVEKGPASELFGLFDSLVAGLFWAGAPVEGHTEKDHPPLAAFEDYIKGLLAETVPVQVKFLQSALKTYPEYDSALLALWQVFNQQGQHTRALAAALQVPSASGSFRRARFLAALSQMQLKQYQPAIDTLEALASQQPAPTVYNNLGVVTLGKGGAGSLASASACFSKAHDLDRTDPDYSFNMGYAAFLDHDMGEAVSRLREAVRLSSADGDAHYVLGAALAASGAQAEGAREKELARRLSSKYADWDRRPAGEQVPRGLARVKEDLEPGPAVRGELAFQTAEQHDQQELARFHLERGRRLFEQKDDREATVELKHSLYFSPYEAEANLLLGRIYLRNGRVGEAIDAIKISLWSRETVEAHIALGEAYLAQKDKPAARAEAERALVLDPASEDAKKLLEKIAGWAGWESQLRSAAVAT
jgi:tetratricopeptide (TPR) repeat protein